MGATVENTDYDVCVGQKSFVLFLPLSNAQFPTRPGYYWKLYTRTEAKSVQVALEELYMFKML